jgi:hypothetical protein
MREIKIILFDGNTRFEKNGKPYVIFKAFNVNNIPTTSFFWLFAKFKDVCNGDIIVDGDIYKFISLQEAFNYAESSNLEFF